MDCFLQFLYNLQTCGLPQEVSRSARVHPNNGKPVKVKPEYRGRGFFVEEIFEQMIDKVIEVDAKKKKSRFRFRGLGRLLGMGGGEKKSTKKKRTFKSFGKATQMGVIAAGKPKSSIEEGEDASEAPKNKWTLKKFAFLGKISGMDNSRHPETAKSKWTLKSIARFFRFGHAPPHSDDNGNEIEENTEVAKKKDLKTYGKLAKMGFLRNETIEKPKSKFSIKGLGKLSKMGLFNSKNTDEVEISNPKRRKTLKTFGKASMLGAGSKNTKNETAGEMGV